MAVRAFHRLIPMPPKMAAALLIMWSPSIEGADRAPSTTDHAATVETEPSAIVVSRGTLRQWVDELAVAESGNRSWIVHEEEDGRRYYGCLQFCEKTFRYYAKKFHLVQAPESGDVLSQIYDCAFQKRLAIRMIRENPDNWKHWRKTVERIGLPPGAKAPLDASVVDPPGRAAN
jgi:hypothetical protein